jgi:hypothetical protein
MVVKSAGAIEDDIEHHLADITILSLQEMINSKVTQQRTRILAKDRTDEVRATSRNEFGVVTTKWTLVVCLVQSVRVKRSEETTKQLSDLSLLLSISLAIAAAANCSGQEFDVLNGKVCKHGK